MKKKTVNKEIFAKRLTKLMEEFGETTYTVADRFSLTSPTISRYMQGKMAAKITTIELMAKYFHVNPVWLMGYDVEKAMPSLPLSIELDNREQGIITAYRTKSEIQLAIDLLLENRECCQLVNKYARLDHSDKIRVSERIDVMLENEKYASTKKALRNA